MKKIDLVVGARPNFIKAFPVYRALGELDYFDLRLINTGQHYDPNMVDVFFKQLNMKKPDINLGIGSGSHGQQTGKVLIEIEKVFIEKMPDLVIVFGDVNSTIAAALAAKKLHISVAHVEAGLRSFDRSMPEEINRVLTDQISDLLFITSPEAEVNLLKEGKDKDQIHFVGNTMIDSLIRFQSLFDSDHIKDMYGLQDKKYILITLHRPSNVDDYNNFIIIIDALNKIAEIEKCLWSVHPRTKKYLDQNKIKLNEKLNITEPLGYLEFMGLQRDAGLIITDSGGIQEESTYFGVPCLTLRENTERPITIKSGTNKLINAKNIFNTIESKQYNNNNYIPKFWDGKSSKRIAKVLEKKL